MGGLFARSSRGGGNARRCGKCAPRLQGRPSQAHGHQRKARTTVPSRKESSREQQPEGSPGPSRRIGGHFRQSRRACPHDPRGDSAIPDPPTSGACRKRTHHQSRLPGQGSPTVILSAGLGGWSFDWGLVQPALAKRTRVCAWDRAGYGFSSPSPEPQDILHTVSDLERALQGAGGLS